MLGGDFVSVSVTSLQGISEEEFAAIPVTYQDGLHDKWWEPPAVTSYL
jgi:hypothetical protein